MKNLNKNITKRKQNNSFIVYIHIRPDINEPFYVGKGIPKRDRSKYGRNQYWHNIVNKNNGIFESKILFEIIELYCNRSFLRQTLLSL